MKIITLDVETVTSGMGNPEWKEGEKGWEEGKFAPLPYHKPVVIAWLIVDLQYEEFKLRSYRTDKSHESYIIKKLAGDFNTGERLVTYNGRAFDMPLLQLRAMYHGVNWSFWNKWRHRFPNYKTPLKHYDLADQLTDYGAGPKFGLDPLCRLIDLEGKSDIDGSQVLDVWNSNIEENRERVRLYCSCDVIDTWICYLHFLQCHVGILNKHALELTYEFIRTTDISHHYKKSLT